MTLETLARNHLEKREDPRKSVGSLRGDVWLILQTHQAQRLVHGRRRSENKPAIIGLIGFADRLKTLWHAARQDDPYADWWLLKIEAAIAGCRTHLTQLFGQFSTLLASQDSFQIALAESSQPHRIGLEFVTPYAFRAAHMLAEYDRLMCAVMTVRHLGVGNPKALNEQLHASTRRLRRVFALPLDYRCYDIDRAAVRQGTQRAQQARERMGEVPDDILRGETLPSLRPNPLRVPLAAPDTHVVLDAGQEDRAKTDEPKAGTP